MTDNFDWSYHPTISDWTRAFSRPQNPTPLETAAWSLSPGGWWDTYKTQIGQPFERGVNRIWDWANTRPGSEARASSETPATLGAQPMAPLPPAPAATPPAAATNPYAALFGQPRPPIKLPDVSQSISVPENPYQKLIMEQLQKGGAGVGMPQKPPMPGAPPELPPIDWSTVNARLEAAKPQSIKADPKEMWIAGLLGAVAGFGDARPGERLGLTLGRMAGSGAATGLGERRRQQELEQQSQKEMRGYEMTRAGIESQQKQTDVARTDANALRTYEHGWKNWQAGMQWANLQSDIQSRNAGLAMQRLQLMSQMGADDRRLALSVDQMKNEIAAGNWDRAFKLSQAEEQRYNNDLTKQLTVLGMVSRDSAGRLGGVPEASRLATAIPQIQAGKIVVPGIDMVSIAKEAQDMLKTMPQLQTNPKAYMETKAQIEQQLILRRIQADPKLFQSTLSVTGGVPWRALMGAGQPAATTGATE